VYHHTDVLKLIAALGGDDISDKKSDITEVAKDKPGKRRMACSLDMDAAALYDAWVLRDRCGTAVSGFWPFFMLDKDKESVRKGQVLEVGTCWNGIVALDGDMFLTPGLRNNADWDTDPLRFRQPPQCLISECALMPLTIRNITGGAPIVMDPSVIVSYSVKWWRYYAVWLRTPVVQLWMNVFENWYWDLWWRMGLGRWLQWNGLDNGKEKGECVVEGWPACNSLDNAAKGAMVLISRGKQRDTT
jgi:hypothetical protein